MMWRVVFGGLYIGEFRDFLMWLGGILKFVLVEIYWCSWRLLMEEEF